MLGDVVDEFTNMDMSDTEGSKDLLAAGVIAQHGHIGFLINNALPLMKGIDTCSYDEFQYALAVGVTAPFYLAKLFAAHFRNGGAIINISSSRDRMSQPQTESYTAAKGGMAPLTHALAISLAGKVRVNSISPGWICTHNTIKSTIRRIQYTINISLLSSNPHRKKISDFFVRFPRLLRLIVRREEKPMIEALYNQYFHDIFLYLKAITHSDDLAEELRKH